MTMRVTNNVRKLLAWLEGAPVPEAQIVAGWFQSHTRQDADAEFRRDEPVQSVIPCGPAESSPKLQIRTRSSHAKGFRRRACTTSGKVAMEFQSDSSPTDSPVRIQHAQPGSRLKPEVRKRKTPSRGLPSDQEVRSCKGRLLMLTNSQRLGFCCRTHPRYS